MGLRTRRQQQAVPQVEVAPQEQAPENLQPLGNSEINELVGDGPARGMQSEMGDKYLSMLSMLGSTELAETVHNNLDILNGDEASEQRPLMGMGRGLYKGWFGKSEEAERRMMVRADVASTLALEGPEAAEQRKLASRSASKETLQEHLAHRTAQVQENPFLVEDGNIDGLTIDETHAQEQEAWEELPEGLDLIHGVVDCDNPAFGDRPDRYRKNMDDKLARPEETLPHLYLSTSLIDPRNAKATDWTGSGLVLDVPKECLLAASSQDLAINNAEIRKPGKLDAEKEAMRSKVDPSGLTGLPSPEQVIENTRVANHNEVAVVGRAPCGEQTVTVKGYYILRAYNGNPITNGKLATSPEREERLTNLATERNVPLRYINAPVMENGLSLKFHPDYAQRDDIQVAQPEDAEEDVVSEDELSDIEEERDAQEAELDAQDG